MVMQFSPNLHRNTSLCPDPEEKGLVTIEPFLGCAESTVLIFDNSTTSSKRVH